MEAISQQFEEGLKSLANTFNDQQKEILLQNQKNEELIETLTDKNLLLEEKMQDSIKVRVNLEQQLRQQNQINDRTRKDLEQLELKYMNLKKVSNQLEEFRRNMVGIIKNTVIASTEDSFQIESKFHQTSGYSQDHSVSGILGSNYQDSIDGMEDIQQSSFRSSQNKQNRPQTEIKKFNPFKDNLTSSFDELVINESSIMTPALDSLFTNNGSRKFVQSSAIGPQFQEYSYKTVSTKSSLLTDDPEYKKYIKEIQSRRIIANDSKISNETKQFGSIDDITIQSSYHDDLQSYSQKGSENKLSRSLDDVDGLQLRSSKGSENNTKAYPDLQYSPINPQNNLTKPKKIVESSETIRQDKDEMDPGKLYRVIREKIGFDEFEEFAKCIGEFNSGTKGAEETITVISKLLGDEHLSFHMKQLILSAQD